ncbi:MAG: hypothetical protein Fur005_36590 [Roseiflexaceae bacterium]
MEIEAKYRVADRSLLSRLLQLQQLGRFTLIPHSTREEQQNSYYDTPDSLLTTQRMSLRIREQHNQRTATLKRSLGGNQGLHIREEWETDIGAIMPPHHWPASEARTRLLALIGERPLIELFRIRTLRQRIAVHDHQVQVAELAFDIGHIRAGGRIWAFVSLRLS